MPDDKFAHGTHRLVLPQQSQAMLMSETGLPQNPLLSPLHSGSRYSAPILATAALQKKKKIEPLNHVNYILLGQ